MGAVEKKLRQVTENFEYRDEYKQHFISVQVGHEDPLFINVTLKSNDLDKVTRAMRRIKEMLETEFHAG
jgi:hypothetical protein